MFDLYSVLPECNYFKFAQMIKRSFFVLLVILFSYEGFSQSENLNDSIQFYYKQENYARAIIFARQVVEKNKKAPQQKDSVYAATLNNLAYLYYLTGNYSAAEPLYLQALAILKKISGEENRYYAT